VFQTDIEETDMPHAEPTLRRLASERWYVAMLLTGAMLIAYFGFILMVAFDKPLMATLVAPGLSLGMLLGALVIVVAWLLTLGYIGWANSRYDANVRAIRQQKGT
jgi:uncharacterized membrane protein (DUF485 family)